jgi:hypothetical protein
MGVGKWCQAALTQDASRPDAQCTSQGGCLFRLDRAPDKA